MRRFLPIAPLVAFALVTPAQAQTQSCARGGDERLIEVLAPGEHGKACDLRYTRDGGANVSTPFFDDADAEFCGERARALAASLTAAGYRCIALSRPVVDPFAAAPSPRGDGLAAPAEDMIAEPVQEAAHAAAPSSETAAPLVQPPRLAESTTMHAAPAREPGPASPATGDPVALAPESGVAPLRAQPSGYGRLVGASPDAAPIASAPAAAAPAPDYAGALPATPAAVSALSAVRPAPDAIRSALAAQVAAWNDGDLEGFMDAYWKSPDLRFVSGATVTRGWTTTLRRYRERYGEGSEMGRLSLEGIDVQLVADDVAVVVGRFALSRRERADFGAFTLVMKRMDGEWRIVHDHSVADAAPVSPASQ